MSTGSSPPLTAMTPDQQPEEPAPQQQQLSLNAHLEIIMSPQMSNSNMNNFAQFCHGKGGAGYGKDSQFGQGKGKGKGRGLRGGNG
jgi:hypothetical protein